MTSQFSIDPSLCRSEVSSLEQELDELKDQLDDIYRRATVNNVPIAQVIVEQIGASPSDLKMLSKVFDRLAVLIAKRNDLAEKHSALDFIVKKDSWIYEKIGAPSRDVEHFLASFTETTPL